MQTMKPEPTPERDAPAEATRQSRQIAEPARPGAARLALVVGEKPEEEEKEAGYGHGV